MASKRTELKCLKEHVRMAAARVANLEYCARVYASAKYGVVRIDSRKGYHLNSAEGILAELDRIGLKYRAFIERAEPTGGRYVGPTGHITRITVPLDQSKGPFGLVD